MFHIISTHSLTKRLTCLCRYFSRRIAISTHSLTKRLTVLISGMAFDMHISTHSLTKRLTISNAPLPNGRDFNSQPHEEADDGSEAITGRPVYISTHSLTKRLTDIFTEKNNDDSISTHSLTKRLTRLV